jgi:tRNA(fMet)-specific endonuclease VapC
VSFETVLVDTNVVSYIHNNHSLAQVYKPHLLGVQTFISFQTVAEMRYGATIKGWGAQRLQELELVLSAYAVIHSDDALISRWGAVRANAKKSGRHIDFADAWIAATALELDIPLVTHNVRDFRFVDGLVIITETEV